MLPQYLHFLNFLLLSSTVFKRKIFWKLVWSCSIIGLRGNPGKILYWAWFYNILWSFSEKVLLPFFFVIWNSRYTHTRHLKGEIFGSWFVLILLLVYKVTPEKRLYRAWLCNVLWSFSEKKLATFFFIIWISRYTHTWHLKGEFFGSWFGLVLYLVYKVTPEKDSVSSPD